MTETKIAFNYSKQLNIVQFFKIQLKQGLWHLHSLKKTLLQKCFLRQPRIPHYAWNWWIFIPEFASRS